MDIKFLLGRTFLMRCSWIRRVTSLVNQGAIPTSYNRTVANLTAAYFLRSMLARHLVRARYGFSPVEVLVSITDWCPHHCTYCYNKSGREEKKADFINLNKLDTVLQEVRRAFGIRFAIITGGEPFPYVLELAARRPDFVFFTYTSGNIDQGTCQEMVKLGNIIPAITIVDTNPTVHSSIRGPGSYGRVMGARDLFRSHQLPWGWSLTSSRKNYEQIVEGKLLEKLASLDPYFIRAMPWMPVGRSDESLVLSLEEMARVGAKIKEARKRGLVVFDYISAPVGYPCLAGGRRSFFLAPDSKDGLRISPCVFMEGEVSVPIDFDENGSTLLQVLRTNPWFVNARALAGKHQCIIHENRGNWRELVCQ